jgi:hypothetical protein
MIVRPKLPPGKDYIESIDSDGNPIYVPTPEQLKKQQRESQFAAIQAESIQIKTQLLQADETVIILFESQLAQESINTQQDEAIISIYEMIGGTSI